MHRSYEQLCPVAIALDRVGDRWTLLIVRELLLGPRRYGELAAALDGIGTNLLAERLRRLLDQGLILHSGRQYELTTRGRELKPALLALARWGAPELSDADARKLTFRPSWLMLSLQALFKPERAEGVSETWEYRVDDEIFWLHVENGTVDAGAGPAAAPALVITTDSDTFREIGQAGLDPARALESGRIRITGEPERFMRSLEIVPPPSR